MALRESPLAAGQKMEHLLVHCGGKVQGPRWGGGLRRQPPRPCDEAVLVSLPAIEREARTFYERRPESATPVGPFAWSCFVEGLRVLLERERWSLGVIDVQVEGAPRAVNPGTDELVLDGVGAFDPLCPKCTATLMRRLREEG